MTGPGSTAAGPRELRLRVNGVEHVVSRLPERTLLDYLRLELGLTGTKYGCGEGRCGACSVLVDGELARACQLTARDADRRDVKTVEGLAPPGSLTPVQEAFAELGAFQCGFCTPGMVVAATALLDRNPSPSREEIVRGMDGNICRCCGYPRILRAIERAAALRGGGRERK